MISQFTLIMTISKVTANMISNWLVVLIFYKNSVYLLKYYKTSEEKDMQGDVGGFVFI